jgi:hypothetical protein
MKDKIKLWKWRKGRQGTGYEIFPILFCDFLKIDLYIVRYKKGSHIPWHFDPVEPKWEHHRLNIIFKDCAVGGKFLFDSRAVHLVKQGIFCKIRWTKFRPDQVEHMVTEVIEGSRTVISFGYVKKEK